MIKDVILENINPNFTYRKSHIENILNRIDFRIIAPPSKLKKGDVIKLKDLPSGNKYRPGVIIKVLSDHVIAIPLTSEENIHSSIPHNSRFWGSGWFCKNYTCVDKKYASKNFYGVFDSPRELNQAIKYIKQYVNKI